MFVTDNDAYYNKLGAMTVYTIKVEQYYFSGEFAMTCKILIF